MSVRRYFAVVAAAVAAFVVIGGRIAGGATATANLNVSATVISNCIISTAPVAFGNYDPISAHAGAPLDAAGTITVTCTQGTSRTVGMDLGGNASGSTRRMADGSGNFLQYELYQDAARTTVWGNAGGALMTPAPNPAANSNAVNLSVYGRVAAGQDAVVGNYSDAVVATVTF